MRYKVAPARLKAVEGEAGTFEAIVSVFGNKDSYGDVVQPGAFTTTLAAWADSGLPIPVYWSHRMDDPDYNIGHVLDAKETDRGLYVKAQLDLDAPTPTSKAPQVYRLLKGNRVANFSFAYDEVATTDEETEDGEPYRALHELKLYEVGPTPIGANQETELLAVKAVAEVATNMTARLKEGRVLAEKHLQTLRDAHQAIGNVIDAATPTTGTGTASGTGPAKDEEPVQAKSEEPSRNPSATSLSAHLSVLARG